MPSWVIVFLVTISYLFFSLFVGLIAGRRASKSTEGYVAGDRSIGFIFLYFIMGAAIYSAFAFLGGPGWAYSRGAAAFYIICYGTVGLVPWYFFGPRVAKLGRKFGYVTQAQLFAHRYESRAIPALLAIISLLAFLPYLTLQMQGAGYVFSVVTEGRIPVWGGAAIAYIVVLIYVFRSGVMAVAWTHTLQGILMLTLAWTLGLYLPYALHGGIGPMFQKLAETVPDMLKAPGLDGAGHVWSWGGFSSSVAISVFGFSVWPHYFMKIYTAKDISTLKKTVVFYPTFQIFLVPIMLIGFAGIHAFPGVTPVDSILPTIVTSMGLPALLVGFFCAGALAASMSTGDAIVHAAASIMVKDFFQVLRWPKIDVKNETQWIKGLVILIGAIAYFFAVFSKLSLVNMLLLSYEAMAQIFPVVLAALYWRRSTPAGVLAGLVAGCTVSLIWLVFPSLQWQQIHPGIFGMVANVFCLIAVSLWTQPMADEHVQQFETE